ncbi:MAG TPA: SAM-dependent methyltransferase [Gammaproteobacteria bacterium]|nr:SAM-dependent methyltransferase [Gammaproteobacteria bacterium]
MKFQTPLQDLPPPPSEAIAYSEALSRHIRGQIEREGSIPFADFMRMALYEAGLGYYMTGLRKFGDGGDFITAPEVSPLFSFCLAGQCLEVMQHIPRASILEFGAGSGVMASDILQFLAQRDRLPEHYYILELSAELQQRQRETIGARVPQLLSRVHWLSNLDHFQFKGVVLANEVLDAMPVRRFQCHADGLRELHVAAGSRDGFEWTLRPAAPELQRALQEIQRDLGYALPEAYTSEWNPGLAPWLQALWHSLDSGVALLIDYGYPRAEYYLPERAMGTLSCHYRHRMHDNPLMLVGLQDITAFVDFSAVAAAGLAAGFEVGGFIDQAGFLVNGGIERLCAEESMQDMAVLQRAQQLKALLLPSEMGERFKVLALHKAYNRALSGFGGADRSHRL